MSKCFIIAEIGVNHNGSLDLARRLVDVAVESGAQAAKFQTFKADELVVKGTSAAEYQINNGTSSDQYEVLKSLELKEKEHEVLFEHCKDRGIEFLSTAFDMSSLEYLIQLGVARFKIPSGELTNVPMLRKMAIHKLPTILSTGMATLSEVSDALQVLDPGRAVGLPRGDIVLLHCTSNYPASLFEVNLEAMRTMATEFSLPIGYSDHTEGVLVAPIAVAAGAKVIEKHITLDRSLPGPDHAASIMPDELAEMIKNIRMVEDILGDAEKKPQESELATRKLVRKGLKFAVDLPANHKITKEDIVILRPESGMRPVMIDAVIGSITARKVAAFEPVDEGCVMLLSDG